MIITEQQLKQLCTNTPIERIREMIPHLNRFPPIFGIDEPIEVANFLAQTMHESGDFKWLRELWGPTTQQLKYERDFTAPWPQTKRGERNYLATMLGNSQKGDGRKFAGGGLIHTTGRANYDRMSKEMFGNDQLLIRPELLALPEYAVHSACIYWKWKKLDLVDDDFNILPETRRVNGGENGKKERQKIFDKAVKVFKIPIPAK